MKKILYILPVVASLSFSCEKEEPTKNNNNYSDTTETENLPKIQEAQVILTVLDVNSNPLDSVACLLPQHDVYTHNTWYYTDSNGKLFHTVFYENDLGGMPSSQYISLEKDGLTDTIYVPLNGHGSTNTHTHILQ